VQLCSEANVYRILGRSFEAWRKLAKHSLCGLLESQSGFSRAHVPLITRKEVELLERQGVIRNTAWERVAVIVRVTRWTTYKLVGREMFECSSRCLGDTASLMVWTGSLYLLAISFHVRCSRSMFCSEMIRLVSSLDVELSITLV
jgi:hypothetical protein